MVEWTIVLLLPDEEVQQDIYHALADIIDILKAAAKAFVNTNEDKE